MPEQKILIVEDDPDTRRMLNMRLLANSIETADLLAAIRQALSESGGGIGQEA